MVDSRGRLYRTRNIQLRYMRWILLRVVCLIGSDLWIRTVCRDGQNLLQMVCLIGSDLWFRMVCRDELVMMWMLGCLFGSDLWFRLVFPLRILLN
jgi:hypothetical protein